MKSIITSAKLFGTLFYQPCSKSELVELVGALAEINHVSPKALNALLAADEKALEHDFSVLFEGMGDMPAPPWGSVYLDKERVLFGNSTLLYRAFLERYGVELDSGLREPEDQFGLMLLALAFLLEQDNQSAAIELLEQHLLPWANAYLVQLNATTNNLFYQQLALNVDTWLQSLISRYALSVAKKKIYTYG